MINRLTYYLLTFVAVFAAACSNIDEMESPVPDQNLVMRFDMGCDTKVSTNDITSQEFIIYDYIYEASSEGYSDGTCYIDGSKVTLKYRNGRWDFYSNNGDTRVDFLWTKTGEHRFYAFNKVEHNVYGTIYPNTFKYNDGDPYIEFGRASLNTQDPVQDVIYSKTSRNVSTSSTPYAPIILDFSHFFSSIKIEVKNVSGEAQNITNFEFEGFNSLSNASAKVYFSGGPNLSFDSNKGKYSSSDVRLENGQSWFPLGVNPIMVWPQSFYTGHNPFFQFKSNDNDKFLLFTDIGVTQWQSGKLHHITLNLAPDPVRLSPAVEITHVLNDDGTTPKYSDVSISLNPTDNKFNRLRNLQITVLDENGTPTGLEYSSATVNSNDIVISGQDKSLALTPGQSFVVKFEYNDTYNDYSNEITVESPPVVLPTVEPALGYYVNNDGTFSETFVEDKSIAKIFWMGDPTTTDPQLRDKFSYCKRGLAYKINGDAVCWEGPSKMGVNAVSKPSGMDSECFSSTVFNGYTNTVVLKSLGATIDVNLTDAVVDGMTSPWYIPSVAEMKGAGLGTPNNQRVWVSTMYDYVGYNLVYSMSYYNGNSRYETTGQYRYMFILAF